MDVGSVVDGRYEIRRPLGVNGGMGDVYLCLDRKLKREVALKLIKPEHANHPEYRERFQREVDAAIALDGYDVVKVHDHGECAERRIPYYVMEYLRGRDLSQEISTRGPLELGRALEILIDVCKVIGAAHQRAIVHRDLKPGNLFLEGPPSPRKSVRVLDFGIARVLSHPRDGAITQLGGQPGSPNYMAPEQHRNEPQVDVAVDIWALGAILFEMVVGERAWPGAAHEARKRILEDAAPSVRAQRPELPNALERIIHKCLEKEPGLRYASVRELEHDLRELQSIARNTSETLPTAVSVSSQTTRSISRPRLAWALALAGLSFLGLLLVLRPWQRQAIAPALAAETPNHAAERRARSDKDLDLPSLPDTSTSTERMENQAAAPQLPVAYVPLAPVGHDVAATLTNTRAPHSAADAGSMRSSTEPKVVLATVTQASAKLALASDKARSSSNPRLGLAGGAPQASSQESSAAAVGSAPKLSRNETRLKTK